MAPVPETSGDLRPQSARGCPSFEHVRLAVSLLFQPPFTAWPCGLRLSNARPQQHPKSLQPLPEELAQLHLAPREPAGAPAGRRWCSLGRHSTPGPPPPAGGRRGRHEQGDSCTTAKVKMAVEDGSATSPKDIRLRPAGAGPAPPWPRRPSTHQSAPPCRGRSSVSVVAAAPP